MTDGPRSHLSGRQAQAARNDAVILRAAREVFIDNPHAPIAAVAARAGVGISALYRRFPSKDALLRRLCRDGLDIFLAAAEAALADAGPPAAVFDRFLQRIVTADTHALTWRLSGLFPPTADLNVDGHRGLVMSEAILARAQAAGVVRADLAWGDMTVLFEQLAAIRFGDAARTDALRRRSLMLMLDGMRPGGPPLPAPPLAWEEMQSRWVPKQ